jgi:hypothetical protein
MTARFTWRFFLLRLIFPLIYAGFFVVQLFAHFDTSLTHPSDRYQILCCHNQPNHPGSFDKFKANRAVVTKFRLNRNFEPSGFTTPVFVCSLPEANFITIQHIGFPAFFIAEQLHNTLLLRGPPTFA